MGRSAERNATMVADEVKPGQFVTRDRKALDAPTLTLAQIGAAEFVVSTRRTEKAVILTLRRASGLTGPITTRKVRVQPDARFRVVKR